MELVSVPGPSAAFLGGIVSYATPLEETLLHVDRSRLAEFGPVDPMVARQMAEGARLACTVDGRPVDLGLATTGVAGPESDEQTGQTAGSVYIVYIGLATSNGARSVQLALTGDRSAIREETVAAAIEEALIELHALALDAV